MQELKLFSGAATLYARRTSGSMVCVFGGAGVEGRRVGGHFRAAEQGEGEVEASVVSR